MTEQPTALHSTVTLERTYPVAPETVFAAWADPAAKGKWFAGGGAYELDFRVGGTERASRPATEDMPALAFEAAYHDIVANQRIVTTSTLFNDGRPATVALQTVELTATPEGTLLTLTEQGTFLDGLERPEWREQGITSQLAALGDELGND